MLSISKSGFGNRRANLLAIGIFCVGSLGGFAIFPVFDWWAHQSALRYARQMGGILYFVNFGRSALLAWAAWATWSVVGAAAYERAVSSAGNATNRDDWRTLGLVARRFSVGAAALSAAFLIGLAADFNTFSVFTRDAYVQRSFPSRGGPAHMWSDARTVELGCKHTPDTYRSFGGDYLIYKVRFDEGAEVHVDEAIPLSGKFTDWLGKLDLIDEELRGSRATFIRWETPLDNRCVAAYFNRLTPADFKRFAKILRIGAFPLDPRV